MYGFTGPRRLSRDEERKIYKRCDLNSCHGQWHVGDAPGLDSYIVRAAQYYRHHDLVIHRVGGDEKWQFAERSKRMVEAIAPYGTLIAFPNKPCPSECTPRTAFSGHGSGTWGTIAYARSKDLRVEVYPLWNSILGLAIAMPDWLFDRQLKLF